MCGNKGTVYVDKFTPEGKIVRTTKLLTDVRDQTGRYTGPTRSFGEPPAEGLLVAESLPEVSTDARDYFVNFINAMQKKEDLLVKPEQIRTVLAVMEAVRESGATMKSVQFEGS
jgi:predicted dehydrogenase